MWIFDRFTYSRRFQMGREEILHPLPFGTNWVSLRIGIRYSINDSARSTSGYAGGNWGYCLYLGVQEGITTRFLDDTVTDWIGGGNIGNTAQPNGNFNSYTAGSPGYYQNGAGGRPNALWKRTTTHTFGSESSVSVYFTGSGENGAVSGLGPQYFCGSYVDITKGSPNYTISPYYCNSAANAQANLTETAFLANMESGATPTFTASAAGKTIAYTGSGLFDTLSVVCTRYWPSTEIGSLAVVRYS